MDTFQLHKSFIRWIVERMREKFHTTTGKHLAILSFLSVGFFLLYLWPSFRMPTMFVSPDETANYFFSNLIATKTSLRSPLPFGGFLGTAVAPRSIAVLQNSYAPGSFLGLPIIAGLFAKVLGAWAILVLPVLLASACVPFFYLVLRRFFSPMVSLLSAILLYIHPAFWYYASRPMFHNALFLSLLIIGSYCFLRMVETGRSTMAIASGVLLSLALWTRTSEAVWVLPLVAFLCATYRHRIPKASFLLFFGMLSIFGARLLTINAAVYGDALGSGYTITTQTSADSTAVTTVHASLSRFVLPFGIHRDRIATAVWQYFFLFLPLPATLFLVGLAMSIRRLIHRRLPRTQIWFFGGAMAVIIWLITYYGSYLFQEFSDPDRLLPSNSHLRYWLPAYVLTLPFCAIALQAIIDHFSRRRFARAVGALILLAVVLLSVRSVLLDPLVGLAQVRTTVVKMIRSNATVQNATEANAVIIAGYSDKVFFPDRFVMVQIPQDPAQRDTAFARILSRTPLYFYRNVAETVSKHDWLTLAATGWSITSVVRDGDNTLYAIHAPPQTTLETNPLTE